MSLPTKTLAGVIIPWTPLTQKALVFAREVSTNPIYNHVLRSFLFGFIIADKLPRLQDRDREAHVIAAILHDIGLPESRTPHSDDKRFEVDGANAARNFLLEQPEASEWSKHRLQLVWDSIALHAIGSIAFHKESEVQACARGIHADFLGPERVQGLTWAEYDGVVREFPRLDLANEFKESMLCLCRTKPGTTFDNTVGEWGKGYLSEQEYVHKSGQALLQTSLMELDKRELLHQETGTT